MYLMLFSIIVACSPLPIIAYWPFDTHLPPVRCGVQKSCIQWLNFYGFNDDNYHDMVATALTRNFGLDKDVHWIAAAYACRLSFGQDILSRGIHPEVSPSYFCGSMVGGAPTYKFVASKNLEKNSCEAYIFMYGYGQLLGDVFNNRLIAKTIGLYMADYQSMWGYMYGNYLLLNPNMDLTPAMFCGRLGKLNPGYPMKMKTLNEVYDCAEMIKYFDFSDSPQYNFEKARNHQYPNDVQMYIPRVVEIYIDFLLRLESSNDPRLQTIEQICHIISVLT